jgi:hypothetical protein
MYVAYFFGYFDVSGSFFRVEETEITVKFRAFNKSSETLGSLQFLGL